jgi:hypothetical protein
MRSIRDSSGCPDDIETDGGAGGCTPRAGKVGPRSNPGPYFSKGQLNDGDHALRVSTVPEFAATYVWDMKRLHQLRVRGSGTQCLFLGIFEMRTES